MGYSVIPQPARINVKNGTCAFKVSSFIKIVGEESTLAARDELTAFLNSVLEIFPSGGEQEIHFTLAESTDKKGSYNISVTKNRIELTSGSEEGLFYAVQTLKQLLFQCGEYLDETEIYDEPEFEIRGLMLDCGRYYFPKKDVFRFIDLMALHKLNEFHWHLSEDQGFRCQLDSAPLLTEIGSVRSHTNFNNKEHSGYYTKADIKEIIAYAHSKYIKVIPEIDTPGHAVSMISAYPELSCFERDLPVATSWGVKHDVLCVGKESTFEFMYRILDELCEMFPDGIIHIGGDEVPETRWKICPHCQKRMKDEGLEDESGLHIYFLDRIADYLKAKGIEVRMWNDRIKDKTVSYDVCWQMWNGSMSDEDVISHMEKGRSFVLSNSAAYYLDLPYGLTSLKDTYCYEPLYYRLKNEQKSFVKGLEVCLWSEFVPDIKTADYTLLPRLGAFCENVWTNAAGKDFERFYGSMKHYYRFLYAHGYYPAPPKRAMPGKVGKFFSALYWERRKLCWAGLQNIIDNRRVMKKYGGSF